MLDVHAPDHGIGNVREFVLHLFTITCGLLIALCLENAAEAWHHRQERLEAEGNIRREIAENRKVLLDAKADLLNEMKNMQAVLVYLEARSESHAADPSGLNVTLHEAELPDAAWRTANSTGAISFMPYEEVEAFSSVYKEQELFQTTSEATLNDYLELSAFVSRTDRLPSSIAPELAQAAVPYVRHALAHLKGMYAVGQGLMETYDRSSK